MTTINPKELRQQGLKHIEQLKVVGDYPTKPYLLEFRILKVRYGYGMCVQDCDCSTTMDSNIRNI